MYDITALPRFLIHSCHFTYDYFANLDYLSFTCLGSAIPLTHRQTLPYSNKLNILLSLIINDRPSDLIPTMAQHSATDMIVDTPTWTNPARGLTPPQNQFPVTVLNPLSPSIEPIKVIRTRRRVIVSANRPLSRYQSPAISTDRARPKRIPDVATLADDSAVINLLRRLDSTCQAQKFLINTLNKKCKKSVSKTAQLHNDLQEFKTLFSRAIVKDEIGGHGDVVVGILPRDATRLFAMMDEADPEISDDEDEDVVEVEYPTAEENEAIERLVGKTVSGPGGRRINDLKAPTAEEREAVEKIWAQRRSELQTDAERKMGRKAKRTARRMAQKAEKERSTAMNIDKAGEEAGVNAVDAAMGGLTFDLPFRAR